MSDTGCSMSQLVMLSTPCLVLLNGKRTTVSENPVTLADISREVRAQLGGLVWQDGAPRESARHEMS